MSEFIRLIKDLYASGINLFEVVNLIVLCLIFYVVWKDSNKTESERCYYRFKNDFDMFSNRQDDFNIKVNEISSNLKYINEDVKRTLKSIEKLKDSISMSSKETGDAYTDIKFKFEEVIHKIELLSNSLDTLIATFGRFSKDGDV